MYSFKSTGAHAPADWLCTVKDTGVSWRSFHLKRPQGQEDTGGQVDG